MHTKGKNDMLLIKYKHTHGKYKDKKIAILRATNYSVIVFLTLDGGNTERQTKHAKYKMDTYFNPVGTASPSNVNLYHDWPSVHFHEIFSSIFLRRVTNSLFDESVS